MVLAIIVGMAAVAIIFFGILMLSAWLIGQALGPEETVTIVYGNPPVTYVVEKIHAIPDGGIFFRLFEKNAKDKIELGTSSKYYDKSEYTDGNGGTDLSDPNFEVTIYKGDGDNPRLQFFYYKPNKRELTPVEMEVNLGTELNTRKSYPFIKYENSELGFSFKYPGIYEGAHCDVEGSKDGEIYFFNIGSNRVQLTIMPTTEKKLNPEKIIRDLKSKGIVVGVPKNVMVNDNEALKIEYRFGGMGRYGEIIYFIHRKKLFSYGFTAGAGECAFNLPTYSKILETLVLSDIKN